MTETASAFATSTLAPAIRATGIAAGALFLSACAQSEPPAPTEPYKVVASEAEFRSLIVDKMMKNPKGFAFTIKSDGTVDGDINGERPVGTWDWKNNQYCRSFKLGSKDFPYQCHVVEVSGMTAQFARDDGTNSRGWKLGG